MGVTYKLTDELISFITHQKQNNPSISCRNLAILVDEKFDIKISKSAINAVFKQLNLNKPLNRPPKKSTSLRKFVIPPERKIQPLGQGVEILDSNSKQESPIKPIASSPLGKKETANTSKRDLQENKVKHVFLGESFKQSKKDAVFVPPFSKESAVHIDSNLMPKTNCFDEESFIDLQLKRLLMLLMIRDFFPGPMMEEFYKRNTSFSQRDINILDVLVCFYPDVFIAPEVSLVEENSIIWKILGWKDIPSTEEIDEIIKYINSTEVSEFDFNLEAEYFLTTVASIDIIMENEQVLTVDGRLNLVVGEEEIFNCPIERALLGIDNFLSGKDFFQLHCSQENFSPELIEKILNLGTKLVNIKKIILKGFNNQVVAQMDNVISKQKGYVLSLELTQSKYEQLLDKIETEIKSRTEGINKEIYFIDEKVNLEKIFPEIKIDQKIRIVVFLEKSGFVRGLVMTNFSRKDLSINDLWKDRMDWYGQRDLESPNSFNKNNLILVSEEGSGEENLGKLLGGLFEKMKMIFVRNGFLYKKVKEFMDMGDKKTVSVKYDKKMSQIILNLNGEGNICKFIKPLSPISYNSKRIKLSIVSEDIKY